MLINATLHSHTHTNTHRQHSIQSCSSASSLCCATIARCPPFVVFIYLRRLVAMEDFIYCLAVSAVARLHSEETCQLSFSRTGSQPRLQPFPRVRRRFVEGSAKSTARIKYL